VIASAYLGGCDFSDRPPRRIGNALQAGAVWRLENTAEGALRYRGPGALPTPTVSLVTFGDGTAARARLDRVAPVDLHGSFLRFRLYVDPHSAGRLRQVNVKLGSGRGAFADNAFQSIAIPSRAGGYGTEFLKPGEWVQPTIAAASLASGGIGHLDFSQVRDFAVEAIDDGSGSATVLFGGMDVVPADARFPRGVVSLTFDDGLRSHYEGARDVLAERGYAGTAYVIRDLVGERGYMTLEQLKQLDRDGWEIALHADTTAAHNSRGGFTGVSSETIRREWVEQARWLRRHGFQGTRDFAYPQGFFDRRVLALAREGGLLDSARTTSFRSVETLPVADPFRLRTIQYDATVPISPPQQRGTIKWRIDQVREYGGWLILGFHDIAGRSGGTNVSREHLREIADYVARRGVPVMTVRDVWRRAAGPGAVTTPVSRSTRG
jgi:peptidoglycan/xylan/chitin deacetylase (PgdA/CDA1 family)